jgi:hypothetical protein
MRAMTFATGALLAALLAACGSHEPGAPGSAAGAAAPKPAPTGNATAEQVAEESRGDLDCPADIDTPARAANAPVDDIVGVRPGLTFEEAANVVMCSGELLVVSPPMTRGFNIKTYGATLRQGFSARFAEPRIEKTSKQIMKEMQDEMTARSGNSVRQDMKPGQAKWYVTTMGMPGKERVIAAAREEWFAEGRNPTMESVAQALTRKYGVPTRSQVLPHIIMLTWTYDPNGRFVPETAPLANRCTAMSSPDGGSTFSPDCGLVIAAQVYPMKENPALSGYMQVGVADQAGGYQSLVDTEQALEAGEMQRRARQVDDAAKNADGPKL